MPSLADGRRGAAVVGAAEFGLRAEPLQGRGAGGAREEEAGQHDVFAQPGAEAGNGSAPFGGP